MSEWRPIETAPKDGTPVLVWDESMGSNKRDGCDDRRYAIGYVRCGWATPHGTWGNRNNSHCSPTHWQPLPAPPETTADD